MSMDLFWSKEGMVACVTHAPTPGSDTWRIQGWQQVPGWRQGINAKVLQCQFCHGRPYAPFARESLGSVNGDFVAASDIPCDIRVATDEDSDEPMT